MNSSAYPPNIIMNKPLLSTRVCSVLSLATLLLLGPVAVPQATAQFVPSAIRIVSCDQPVKSLKRGVCLNHMAAQDFMALSPSVSWWYNWNFNETEPLPEKAHMEFLPMAWGDRAEDLAGLKAYLAKHKPSHVLAINEPNLKGQAYITPEQTAQLYKKIKVIADSRHIPVVGPHMALGSAENASITAMDPLEHKQMTYTFMVPYLKAFLSFMGETEAPAVAAHTYGSSGEAKWMVEMMHKEFNRPVWVTEFAQWNAPSPEAEREYLIQTVDYFERTPYVQGYAWFKERVSGNPKLSLLDTEPGKLTPLGETYVHMPVHDPNVFYRLPGRLQAESYVTMENADIAATDDRDGFLEMRLQGPQSQLDYNVSVPQPGVFSVKVRFAGSPAKIEILSGNTVLASVQSQSEGWQTAETAITMPGGVQALRVRASAPVRINWMELQGNRL